MASQEESLHTEEEKASLASQEGGSQRCSGGRVVFLFLEVLPHPSIRPASFKPDHPGASFSAGDP